MTEKVENGSVASSNVQSEEKSSVEDDAAAERIPISGNFRFFGAQQNYGLPPELRADTVAEFAVFEPNYICLMFVNLSDLERMSVNYAHFYMNGKFREEDRLERAVLLFKEKLDDPQKRFKNFSPDVPYGGKDYTNFQHVGFKSQTEIFILYYVRDPDCLRLAGDNLVSFSTNPNGTTRVHQNYSFVNATIVAEDAVPGHIVRMIRLRNYTFDEGLNLIDWQHQEYRRYAMNLHFQIMCDDPDRKPGDPLQFIPMIIDPDTGNGYGNEP